MGGVYLFSIESLCGSDLSAMMTGPFCSRPPMDLCNLQLNKSVYLFVQCPL